MDRGERVSGSQLASPPVIDGRTHFRLTLSQISVGSGDCWIVATSGHRGTPRSDRNRSMTPSSSARRGPTLIGAALITRRIAGVLRSTSSRATGGASRGAVLGVTATRSYDARAITGCGLAPPLPVPRPEPLLPASL